MRGMRQANIPPQLSFYPIRDNAMSDWYFWLEREVNMTGKTDRGLEALNQISEAAQLDHFHQRNMLMLEAVISAMLDVHDHSGVAAILREHADQLEDFG